MCAHVCVSVCYVFVGDRERMQERERRRERGRERGEEEEGERGKKK